MKDDMAFRPELRHVNTLSLCAGVGGLELGIRIAEPRARGVCYVEREAFAAAVLQARMEDQALHAAPIWSDLATFDARPWRGTVHCVTSGDPCQPNSVAGQRKGADDERFLIDQVLRIVDECRPDRLFRENVFGNADGQLAALVPALEGMGYRVAAGIFSAGEAGASHRRERLFIMADRGLDNAVRGQEGQPGCVGHAHGGDERVGHAQDNHRRSKLKTQGSRRGRCGPARAGGALADLRLGDTNSAYSQGERPDNCSQRRQEPDGPAGLPGGTGLPIFAPGPADPRWPAIIAAAPQLEPAVCRVADGMAARLDLTHRVDRLRACGNGVVPMAAALAWLSLDATLAAERGAGQRAGEFVLT